MGIWGRLGNVIKSYINDEDDKIHWRSSPRTRPDDMHSNDKDYQAACEELDEFLRGDDKARKSPKSEGSGEAEGKKARMVPDEIREDFASLNLTPQATAEECKAAYKRILKALHPDRHAASPENMKEATEKTASLNAAYKRLERWFRFQNG